MKALDYSSTLSAVAKGLGKWCMYIGIHNDLEAIDDILQAAPCLKDLDDEDGGYFIADGGGILVFDSEEECRTAFESTVGEDGPTPTNHYNGPVKVFATTCNPQGKGMAVNS